MSETIRDQALWERFAFSASSGRRRFALMGCTLDIHAALEDTGNTSLIEVGIPPRFPGAPPHLHEHTTESFYVLEGNIDVLHDGKWRETRRGDFFLIPPRMVHGYRNSTDKPARFLVMAPGHDRYYFALVDWMYREPIWPPTDREALVAFGRRHDTIYVGSPTDREDIHAFGSRQDTMYV
jgi:quercetin dioxygenase-like cupin family protein